MAPVIGFSFILCALLLSFAQPVYYFIKRNSNNQQKQLEIAQIITTFSAFLCCGAMISLIYSYVISDFSVLNVYLNSHTLKPLIYKISGAWGNHEGSMLMLLCIISFYNLAFIFLSNAPQKLKILIISSQSSISFGLLTFVTFFSNPFLRLVPTAPEGSGLNPILQDIGLALHPPMLYVGYIGFSLVFSFAIAALISQKIDRNFAKYLRPWLTFSWSFLTLGIGLGSWWAYRELGWGGYWFWDPVENVSLMPWLAGTSLIHLIISLQKTGHFRITSCFMAILTFTMCLLGIFLVRSGIITSVHSFASDPGRGIFILILILAIAGTGFIIFFINSLKLKTTPANFTIFSKNGLILINNIIFCSALFIVLLGTLYPLILQSFFNLSISIGADYYQTMFTFLTIIALISMLIVPDGNKKFSNIKPPIILGHIGIAVIIIGITFSAIFAQTKELNMKVGDVTNVKNYQIKFDKIKYDAGKNYLIQAGIFDISKQNDNFTLRSESRYYPISHQTTFEAAIKHRITHDLYLVLGQGDENENYAVRIYYKPLISLLWLGCILIFASGITFILQNKLGIHAKIKHK